MRRPVLALGLLVSSVLASGCATTSSTEVGVRTTMLGVLSRRGEQQIYDPGGVYLVLPVVNTWQVLPISQQNLLMNANPNEGDRPVPDDITFKTRDGNNVHIDVNVMWRVDPRRAPYIANSVGESIDAITERVVRPIARSVIRDVFNQITSEEYYHVTVKNETAEKARERLALELERFGILVDMLQVQQHRFDKEYQEAINAQKQAEADVQTLIEQQKAMEQQKGAELEGKRALWNQRLEDELGAAGRIKNEADAYTQTKTNAAKAMIAVAQAEAEGVRKEAEALSKMGGDAYVRMQVAKMLAEKKVWLVPAANVSTMDVNKMTNFLIGRSQGEQP